MGKDAGPSNAVLAAVASAATMAAPLGRKEDESKNNADGIKICNSNGYQLAAKSILSKPLYEYLASGTDDEQTLSENVSRMVHPLSSHRCT